MFKVISAKIIPINMMIMSHLKKIHGAMIQAEVLAIPKMRRILEHEEEVKRQAGTTEDIKKAKRVSH